MADWSPRRGLSLRRYAALCVALHGVASLAFGDEPQGETPAAAATFEGQVAPFLARYCTNCHGGEKPRAGLDLAKFRDASALEGNRRVWQRVVENLESGD